jgi:sulfur carrier protein
VTVDVVVNGELVRVPEGATVADVVNRLLPGGCSRTAVALAGEVVPAGRWATTRVAPGDQLEVLQAVAGG